MKFRHTNFMRLIYATLLALPFVAILSRVIYVQSNKNAYESYTQNTYKVIQPIYYETNEINTVDDIVYGNIYTINNINQYFGSEIKINSLFYNITTYSYESDQQNGSLLNYNILFYGTNSNTAYAMRVYEQDQNNIDIYHNYLNYSIDVVINEGVNLNLIINYISECQNSYLKEYAEVVQEGTLDNVFEYSVNKFIQNNNLGRINLFQWTTDLFFDSNDVNNMYVGFINWYLNYTLLVSATYILFLVLMWFINYARRLLERGMNYDW